MTSYPVPLLCLLDDASIPAAILDAQGHVLSANQRLRESGFSSVSSTHWTSWAVEEKSSLLAREWCECVAARKNFAVEFEARLANSGSPSLWTLNAASLDVLPASSVPLWICTLKARQFEKVDATEDSSDSSAGLRAALRAGGMALWEWNPATDEALWSPLLYDMLEVPHGTGMEKGARFLSFLHPDDPYASEQLMSQLLGNEEMPPARVRILSGKGNVRWLLSCGQAQRDVKGKLLRVIGVNQDVTDQVLASQRLSSALADASRRASILQAVMEHAPVGIALSLQNDPDISFVSKAGVQMIESTISQAQQWDAWQVYHLDGVTPALKEEMALHRAVEGEIVQDEEWLIRKADGHLLPVRCHAGPVLDQFGTRIGGVVAWYDITPFKQSAARLEELHKLAATAHAAAEKANTAKDHFLAMLSHELRNPLAAILNWTQVLLSGQADEAAARRGVEVIRRNAKDQSRLIDDLLDVSRIVTGKLDVRFKPVDVSDVVSLALETVRSSAQDKRIELVADFSTELQVSGDPLRLQQVFWNLLSNAIKFSPSGSTVTVTGRIDGPYVKVSVTDQGIGLSSDLLPHVFERFRQGPSGESATQAGLGLGLAIAEHIVQRHGGSITAASKGAGQGATFLVQLPSA